MVFLIFMLFIYLLDGISELFSVLAKIPSSFIWFADINILSNWNNK